jgi:hypothetical protein
MRGEPTTGGPPQAEPPELRSDLVDLSGLTLAELEDLPPTALTGSLVRILADRERQPNSYDQNYHANI